MNLLLDTHALIWLTEADNHLSQPAKSAIETPVNTCFVSVASFLKMAIRRFPRMNVPKSRRIFVHFQGVKIGA